MAYCVYPWVDSGAVTHFVALAAEPGAAGQPAMYVGLSVVGGDAPPAVTLTCGSGSCTPGFNQGATTFSFDGKNVDITYTDAPPTAPVRGLGRRYQLRFVLDPGTTLEMINRTVWSLSITGSVEQSFAFVVADHEVESFHDVAAPIVNGQRLEVMGPQTVLRGGNPTIHWIVAGNSQALGFDMVNKTVRLGPSWRWFNGGSVPVPASDGPVASPAVVPPIHAAPGGPDLVLRFRGEARLSHGRAEVHLPEQFEAVTRKEGRTVQLTPRFEGDGPVSALAASAVVDGRFQIRAIDGANPSQRFYWEVEAERSEA